MGYILPEFPLMELCFAVHFFSGIGDDSAQLTYIQVANLRKISAELWPEIVVN